MENVDVIEANLENPRHQTAIVELLDAYAKDPMGGGSGLSEKVKAELIPNLQKQPGTLIFLAVLENQFVGLANCFTGFSTFAAKPLINIHDVTVRSEVRGKGIGKALLEAVAAKAKELGYCKLTLEVRDDNPAAMGLYQKVGFANPTAYDDVMVRFLEKKL